MSFNQIKISKLIATAPLFHCSALFYILCDVIITENWGKKSFIETITIKFFLESNGKNF